MAICMYSCLRALFTKMVEPDETGKVFSAIAILVAVVPAGFGPMYKKVYNASLEADFPAAFLLLAGILYGVVCLLCMVLWFNRKQMTVGDKEKEVDMALEEKKKEAQE